jgi:hypothetical protein
MAAWIEGAVAHEVDAPGDPLVIGILAPAGQVDLLADELFVALSDVMRSYDVLIEVRRRTKADLATASSRELDELSRAIPLVGPLPTPYDEARSDRPREEAYREEGTEVDRRLLNLAALIADRLARDPSLVEGAQRYITRRLERASPAERRELLEWRQLLSNTSLAQLRKFLVDPGERAARLRQTLPFVDVLSKEERDSVFLRADS